MGLSRRMFTREFKLAAIEQLETGVSVAEVARAFEVHPSPAPIQVMDKSHYCKWGLVEAACDSLEPAQRLP